MSDTESNESGLAEKVSPKIFPKAHLTKVACKYLGVVATLVPSKRLFSTAGNIVNAKRSALDPEIVESLVFYFDNLPQLSLPYTKALTTKCMFTIV